MNWRLFFFTCNNSYFTLYCMEISIFAGLSLGKKRLHCFTTGWPACWPSRWLCTLRALLWHGASRCTDWHKTFPSSGTATYYSQKQEKSYRLSNCKSLKFSKLRLRASSASLRPQTSCTQWQNHSQSQTPFHSDMPGGRYLLTDLTTSSWSQRRICALRQLSNMQLWSGHRGGRTGKDYSKEAHTARRGMCCFRKQAFSQTSSSGIRLASSQPQTRERGSLKIPQLNPALTLLMMERLLVLIFSK